MKRLLATLVAPTLSAAAPGTDTAPAERLIAELVEATSFEELEVLGEARVRGKIVLFNKPIPPGSDTLDKVDAKELAEATAALAVMAFALADAPEPLPRPAPDHPRGR